MKKKIRSNTLTLKWGTLKSWSFSEDQNGIDLLNKYLEIGASASAMMQEDTPEQKEIICQLIDLVYGKIYLDWDDKWVTKKEAKKYVMEYSN